MSDKEQMKKQDDAADDDEKEENIIRDSTVRLMLDAGERLRLQQVRIRMSICIACMIIELRLITCPSSSSLHHIIIIIIINTSSLAMMIYIMMIGDDRNIYCHLSSIL